MDLTLKLLLRLTFYQRITRGLSWIENKKQRKLFTSSNQPTPHVGEESGLLTNHKKYQNQVE